MSDEQEPSQHEANKMVRVLKGEKQKYTIRVHLPDKRIIEWQAEKPPALAWNDAARALWLMSDSYHSNPVMAWTEGSMLFCEENPK